MHKNYQLTLFLTLIIFTTAIAFFLATSNYLQLREHAIESNERYVEQATELALHELNSLDDTYYLLNHEIAEKMEDNMSILLDEYKTNPNIGTWEIDSMAKDLGMDIYIINENNVITHTNVSEDVNLDFNECCRDFVSVLNERRQLNEIFIDGLEIGQQTGSLQKYSYHSTPDNAYLFELGYNIENDNTYEKYNFLTLIDKLIEEILPIENIRVINYSGFVYGSDRESLVGKQLSAFEEARNHNKQIEIQDEKEDKMVTIRYIPSFFEYDSAKVNLNVVEISYTNQEITDLLNQIKRLFITQLILSLLITTILSGVLSRWLAKPLDMAFHDSLTGLKNRGAYDEDLSALLQEDKQKSLLILLDIDNFKLINDQLGHAKGDEVLILFGKMIQQLIHHQQYCYRLGGDEFVILLREADYNEARAVAQRVIDGFDELLKQMDGVKDLPISVSVGFTVSKKGDAPTDLIKAADIALYKSKNKTGAEKIQQQERDA